MDDRLVYEYINLYIYKSGTREKTHNLQDWIKIGRKSLKKPIKHDTNLFIGLTYTINFPARLAYELARWSRYRLFCFLPRLELLFHKIVAAQHCSSRSDSHEHAHGPIALVVGRACGAIAQHQHLPPLGVG